MKEYFRGVAKKMRAHQEIASAVGPGSEQGSSNERQVVKFLEDYLPKRYAVGRGKVLSSNEEDSAQIDVIIYDAQRGSPFYTEEGLLIAAVESVYAVVEIKTTLDKPELVDANQKALSVLTKPILQTVNQTANVIRTGHTQPPLASCFAFSSSTPIEALVTNLNELTASGPNCLSIVCVLDKGILLPYRSGWRHFGSEEDALLLYLGMMIDNLHGMPDRQSRLKDYFGIPADDRRKII
jgi:hypothetical protein